MLYTGLITLDLNYTTSIERDRFYEILTQKKWIKIDSLTTAWVKTFDQDISRDQAFIILQLDIETASRLSKVKSVEFAIQVGKGKVETGRMK